MNQFGKEFRLSIFGESHGTGVGISIDGVPAGLPLNEDDFKNDILRRKSGGKGTTPRIEGDEPRILNGVYNGFTTGAPLMVYFDNTNTRSRDYAFVHDTPRPGHADFTAFKKYGGFEDYRGGGHFSGRLTLGIVAAGVVAKKMIGAVSVNAKILELGGSVELDKVLDTAIEKGDSIGGIIECTASNMPVGIGEPFFDSLEALIAHMVFSIPAVKGIEFGSGFAAAKMTGSQHNDNFIDVNGKTETNNAGGINGGISNGNDLILRVAVKPTSSIHVKQHTISLKEGVRKDLEVEGRHDTCIAVRFPVVLESAVAIVLADLMLQAQLIPRINSKGYIGK